MIPRQNNIFTSWREQWKCLNRRILFTTKTDFYNNELLILKCRKVSIFGVIVKYKKLMLIGISLFFGVHQYIQATGKIATVNIDQFWNYVHRKIVTNWPSMLMHNYQSPNNNTTQYTIVSVLVAQTDRFWKNSWRNSELFGDLKQSEMWILVSLSLVVSERILEGTASFLET